MATITGATRLKSMLKDDGVYSTPCYVFDSHAFDDNAEGFFYAFAKVFDSFAVGYSFKTNASRHVIKAARQFPGLMAEIVSDDEYAMAKNVGFAPSEVIYNGVIPDPDGKFEVAARGGIVNIENLRELKVMIRKAESLMTEVEVGLRISFRPNGRDSRFGFVYGSGQYAEALDLAKSSKYLSIAGIHCHGHGDRYLSGWRKRVEYLAPIAKELNAEYIDFGSNLFGPMDERLKQQFDCHVPTADEYAETIYKGLHDAYNGLKIPKVIIEPGTPLVSNAVSLVGRVLDIREHNSHCAIQVDCSKYNCGYFLWSDKELPIDVISIEDEGRCVDGAHVYGYTCAESDVIVEDFSGPVSVGDFLVVRNVGAYGNSLSSNFIKKSPSTRVIAGFNDYFD